MRSPARSRTSELRATSRVNKVLSSPHCFQILHKRANQTVARESCKDVGGRLLQVKGDEKQEAIEKVVKETLRNWEGRWFWIGLTRSYVDVGEFLWEGSQSQPTFTNWAPNHPRRNDDCAGIQSKQDTNFLWYGKRCERSINNIICEK